VNLEVILDEYIIGPNFDGFRAVGIWNLAHADSRQSLKATFTPNFYQLKCSPSKNMICGVDYFPNKGALTHSNRNITRYQPWPFLELATAVTGSQTLRTLFLELSASADHCKGRRHTRVRSSIITFPLAVTACICVFSANRSKIAVEVSTHHFFPYTNFKQLFVYFPNLKKKSRSMWSPCCLCVCISVCLCIPPIKSWLTEPMFMKLGMYIMATESISTAYFLNPSHQPVCLCVHPPHRC
jgi:hypothetical protein